jgi:hypothetical protein
MLIREVPAPYGYEDGGRSSRWPRRKTDARPDRPGLSGAICVLVLCLIAAPDADADSIHLKNGGVIHSEWTRVEGEYVIFSHYGGQARIPLAAVDRIESDSEAEPAPVPTPSQAEYRAELVRRYSEAGLSSPVRGTAASGGEDGGAGAADTSKNEPAGGMTGDWRSLSPASREYWQLRVEEIHERITRIEMEIDRLPKYNYLEEGILDGRILWVIQEKERFEERARELQDDLRTVKEEARKAGIPPGWLRLSREARPSPPADAG